MKTNINKSKKGFTLVELLVVLAIIGLLAAIGIPAVLRAQRAARNTARLKALEGVRAAFAEVYTKSNATDCAPTMSTTLNASSQYEVHGGTSATQGCPTGNSTRNFAVIDPTAAENGGYTLTYLGTGNCAAADASPSSVANFRYNANITGNNFNLQLCREGGGVDTIGIK